MKSVQTIDNPRPLETWFSSGRLASSSSHSPSTRLSTMFETCQLQCDSRLVRTMFTMREKPTRSTSASPEVSNGCINRPIWRRQMDTKKNWVYRRSNVVDRLQKEGLESRLSLYKGLERILNTDADDCADQALESAALKKLAHKPHEDSALGTSLIDESLGGTFVHAALNSTEENVSGISDTAEFSHDDHGETVQLFPQNNVPERSDWERAEEFHAALGAELDVVRQEIASILKDGSILFPLELISRLYLRYGRRLPQLHEGYSTKDLLAWLECNSRLELDHLIFGL